MKKNELKVGVILSYAQMILSNLISIVYTPIMLRILGQNEYGLMSLTSSVVNYLGLLKFGLGSSYNFFFYKAKKEEDKDAIAKLNGTYMSVFLVFALVAIVAGLVLVNNVELVFGTGLTKAELEKARVLMFLMVISIAITFPQSVFSSYINANESFIFQRTVNMLSTIVSPMLNFPLLFMGYRSIALTMCSVIMTIVNTIVLVVYCFKKLNMRFKFGGLQIAIVKSMFNFSFFIFLNQIVDEINWNIDRYVIARFYGTASVAIYSVGSSINRYYISLSSTIASVFSPRINRIVAEKNDNTELTKLMTRIGRIQFMMLSLIMTGFVFFGYYFITGFYAGAGYEEAYVVAVILIVPITVPLIQNVGIEIQRAKNQHQFRSLVYVSIAIFNLLISIPLCKQLGIIGSAIGTSVGIVLGNFLVMNWFYHAKLGLDMKYFWKNIISIIPAEVLPVCLGIVFWKIIKIDSLLSFLVCGVIYVIAFILALWIWAMNESEKDLLRKPFAKLLCKLKRY